MQPGDLIDKGLARPGRLNREHIVARDDRAHDLFLKRSKRVEAKHGLQRGMKGIGP